jgi:uncharacterized protein (DUF302 family)
VLAQEYEEAIDLVTSALKEQGFGILTRIDVKETLKEKLDVEFRPYAILGACNPPLAYKALTSDPKVGLMLPCNVTVESRGTSGSVVRLINPALMVQFVENPDQPGLQEAAREATKRIGQVVETLKQNG